MEILLWTGRIVLGLMFVAASGMVLFQTIAQVRQGFALMSHAGTTEAEGFRQERAQTKLRVVKAPPKDEPLRRAA